MKKFKDRFNKECGDGFDSSWATAVKYWNIQRQISEWFWTSSIVRPCGAVAVRVTKRQTEAHERKF
jgi:hypothetical protein